MRLPNNCIWSSFDSHPVVCAIIDLLLKWEYHVCFDGRFLTFAARVEAINYWRRRDRSRCSWLITICFRNNSATWRHLKASPVSQSALPALHYPCPYPTQPPSSRSRTYRSWLRHQSRDTVAAELLPVYLLRRRLSHGHPTMQQRVAVCDKFNSHFAHLLQKKRQPTLPPTSPPPPSNRSCGRRAWHGSDCAPPWRGFANGYHRK